MDCLLPIVFIFIVICAFGISAALFLEDPKSTTDENAGNDAGKEGR